MFLFATQKQLMLKPMQLGSSISCKWLFVEGIEERCVDDNEREAKNPLSWERMLQYRATRVSLVEISNRKPHVKVK
jgi:hypothetical protein